MTNRDEILLPEKIGSDVELLIALLKLASMIGRPMHEGVATPQGLSTNELRVLMCVGSEGPVAGHDISQTMSIAPMNVSRALAELDSRGWIKQVENGDNRRRRPVELSDQGWEALGSMIPNVREIAEFIFSTVRKPERGKLFDLVTRINDQIDHWSPRESSGPLKKTA